MSDKSLLLNDGFGNLDTGRKVIGEDASKRVLGVTLILLPVGENVTGPCRAPWLRQPSLVDRYLSRYVPSTGSIHLSLLSLGSALVRGSLSRLRTGC
jgi:hypothetical protein